MKDNKKLEIFHDRVVVGSSFDAVYHAFKEGLPIFFVNKQPPFELDFFDNGINKKIYYDRMIFLLSLAGLIPCSNCVNFLSIVDNQTLNITLKNPIKVVVKTNLIDDFSSMTFIKEKIKIVDSFMVENLYMEKDFIAHKRRALFVNKIFFKKKKIDFNSNVEKLLTVSFLKQNEISQNAFSTINSRLKTIEVLKSHDIEGLIYYNKKTNQNTLKKMKIDFLKRESVSSTDLENPDFISKNKYLQKLINLYKMHKF